MRYNCGMNLITVIPLTRQKVADKLTYFTASEPPVGAIVSVPIRSKTVHAIVADSQPAEKMKAALRSAPFEIKKLGNVKATKFFTDSFMRAIGKLTDYVAANAGAVIDALVNDNILNNAGKIATPTDVDVGNNSNSLNKSNVEHESRHTDTITGKNEIYAIQGDDNDRVSSWRSLIRQEFARKKSIAFYLPTIEDLNWLYGSLVKGIEGYIFALNGGLTKKKIAETWQKIAETDHPVVILATGSFSVLPRNDIETIIIERENGRGWMTQKAPYIDLRLALETIARESSRKTYLADCLLRVETLRRLEDGDIVAGSPFKWRSLSDATDSLVNMAKKTKSAAGTNGDNSENKFRVLSAELEELISQNRERSTHLFVFTVRRGLASMTVCDDCETIVTCNNCSAPVVLHASKNPSSDVRNFFMCHKCGERRSAEETCKNCGGWRLTPLGLGSDRVCGEIKARFPDMDIFKIDADETSDDKQVKAVMEKFQARPGSVLVGTELAVAHLPSAVDHIAVASLDSLFALPDFRIPEKVMYLLTRLRATAKRSIVVQTRRSEEKVFEYGLKGNLSDFYRDTAEERKRFDYPPYKTLVKITIEGKKDPIARAMAEIKHAVEPYELEVFPAFTAAVRGNSIIHGLVRIERNRWPDLSLIAKLRALPPSVSVKVDPESLL